MADHHQLVRVLLWLYGAGALTALILLTDVGFPAAAIFAVINVINWLSHRALWRSLGDNAE
jgi:hypothetical protein